MYNRDTFYYNIFRHGHIKVPEHAYQITGMAISILMVVDFLVIFVLQFRIEIDHYPQDFQITHLRFAFLSVVFFYGKVHSLKIPARNSRKIYVFLFSI